jgi:hypothetical protein
LLLGVTNYLTTDIAAIPLLWVIPLALYLTTFVLAFSPRSPIPHAFVVRWQPLTIIPAAIFLFWSAYLTIAFLLPFHVWMFFAAALLCHGELAARRPGADRLTEFYLWVAGGGALGGLFNVLVAPAVFRSITEYPLILALVPVAAARRGNHSAWRHLRQPLVAGAALLVPWFFLAPYSNPGTHAPPGLMAVGLAGSCIAAVACYQHRSRPAMLSAALLAIAGVSVFADYTSPGWILRERDFFGVHRIMDDPAAGVHILYNGTTRHGAQSTKLGHRREPLSYHARSGPVGDLFRDLDGTSRRRVGVVGLGTGAMAAYARPTEHWTFFELDPAVVRIAQDPRFFTYLTDSKAGTEIIVGDGRLSLARVPDASLDLLVLDAFSSDAIPIHLLTTQTFALYFRKLSPHGVLAVHLSNRYLDLEPVVAKVVMDRGLVGRVRSDTDLGRRPLVFVDPSIWAVVARSELDLRGLASESEWGAMRQDSRPVWTDDFSNVMEALR